MSLDELIQAANELDETELDRLLQQIVTLRAQRKARVLPAEEADLLDRINPRRMAWSEHFVWNDNAEKMLGITAIGRATVAFSGCEKPI
ncbi:MAG: hypothetical protein ACFCU9_06795 [Cyanophyceae cyanobacterium]